MQKCVPTLPGACHNSGLITSILVIFIVISSIISLIFINIVIIRIIIRMIIGIGLYYSYFGCHCYIIIYYC